MTKREIDTICAYYELKSAIATELEIAQELKRVFKSIDEYDQVTFVNGKIQAFNNIQAMIDRMINKIRGIENEDKNY